MMNMYSIVSDDDEHEHQTQRQEPPRRWRLWHVVLTIIFATTIIAVVTTALFLLFGGNLIAERAIDGSQFVLTNFELRGPFTSDSVWAKVTGQVIAPYWASGISVSATVSSLEALYEGTPFAQLLGNISLSISGSNNTFTTLCQLRITNSTQWDKFGSALLASDLLFWTFRGVSSVRAFSFEWSNVFVEKTLSTNGCRGLVNSTSVVTFSFDQSTEETIVADMVFQISNPSNQLSLQPLPDISMALTAADGRHVGRIFTIGGIFLKAGEKSNITARFFLNSTDVETSSQLQLVSSIVSAVVARDSVALTAVGTSCVEDIFTSIVSSVSLGVVIPADVIQAQIPPLISGFNVTQLEVTPLSQDTVSVVMHAQLIAHSPLGPRCSMEIASIAFDQDRTFLQSKNDKIVGVARLLPIHAGIDMFQTQLGNVITVNSSLSGVLQLTNGAGNSTRHEFVSFVRDFLRSDSVELAFQSMFSASVAVSALNTTAGNLFLENIPLNAATVVNGMKGLSDVRLDGISLPADSPDGLGVLIAVNTSVFNPSIVSLTLASESPLCMATIFNGDVISVVNSTQAPLVLQNGWSSFSMAGVVTPTNLTSASIFFSRYMRGLTTELEVRALPQCAPPNIPWLADILADIIVRVNVTGVVGCELVQMVEIEELLMDFGPANYTLGIVAVGTGTIKATWKSPFTFPFQVVDLSMTMVMLFDGWPIARMDLPALPTANVITSPGAGYLVVSFNNVPVVLESFAVFTKYVDALVLQPHALMGIEGNATIDTQVSFGNATLSHLPYSQQILLNGVDSFACPGCVRVFSVDLVGGQPGLGLFELNLELVSHATASLYMGELSVQIYYQDTLLGVGTVLNAALNVGPNNFTVHARLEQSSANQLACRDFFSNFVQGKALPVVMHGFSDGTSIPVAKHAFSQLNASAVIPGSLERLVRYGQLVWSWKIFTLKLPVKLTIFNPYSSSISITYAAFNVDYKGKLVASVSVDWTKDPIIIPPRSVQVTRNIDASIEGVSLDFLKTLIGEIRISVSGSLTVSVGSGFVQSLDYRQSDIPASFQKEHSLIFD